MSSTERFSAKRRRSWAVSVAVLAAMFSGLTSVSASAQEDIVVSGTVENCTISIDGPGSIDLGVPTIDNSGAPPNYLFRTDSPDAFTVTWETSSLTDCAGALHAEHLGVKKDGGATSVENAWLSLSTDAFGTSPQSINQGSTVEVATSQGGPAGDSEEFDVELLVSSSEGAGVYSATIRFTVVVS